MTNTNIIAIDGPAASGKGTLARRVAERLGYAHMDTGLLYRAVALAVLEAGKNPADPAIAAKAATDFSAAFTARPVLESKERLKEERVTEAASHVASIPEVRSILLNLQKNFAKNPGNGFKGAVLDGRDIGTVICPEAPVKLFVTASIETRARRRFKELQSKGETTTYEAVLRDMQERDTRDAARSTAPMKMAVDAVLLETTSLKPDDVLEKALSVIRQKLAFA